MALDNPTHNANEGTDGGDPGRVTLTATEDDDTDGGDDGAGDQGGADEAAARQAAGVPQTARPAKAGGRAERRRIWEANERLTRELGEARGQITTMQSTFQQQMKELRDAVTTRPAPAQQQGGGQSESPMQQQIKTLTQAKNSEIAALRNHDPRKGDYDLTRYYEIEEQLHAARTEAAFDAFLRKRGFDPDAKPRPQVQQQDPNATAAQVQMIQIRDTVFQENPWLTVDGPSGDSARGSMSAMVTFLLKSGRPNTLATHREAAARVARELNVPQARPRGNPQRYVDVGDDNRGGGRPTSVTVPAEMLEGTGLPPAAIRRAVGLSK